VHKLLYAARLTVPKIAAENDLRGIRMRSTRPRQPKPLSPKQPAYCRSLGEACRELQLDSHGMRCPACPLKVLCMTETRWRVPRDPQQRYLT